MSDIIGLSHLLQIGDFDLLRICSVLLCLNAVFQVNKQTNPRIAVFRILLGLRICLLKGFDRFSADAFCIVGK